MCASMLLSFLPTLAFIGVGDSSAARVDGGSGAVRSLRAGDGDGDGVGDSEGDSWWLFSSHS